MSGEPRPISEGVERVLRHLAAPSADTVSGIFEHWTDVVGPGIAEHTRPISIEDGCLVIAVDDATWASHLQWSQDEIVAKVAARLDQDDIDRIRTVVRPPPTRSE
ncbi:MAG: DUF721 domain-containing protein [Acidimicrobiia bacterium]|nr:DUF721 domain-containing protein [Acidimicrobiia bacterium]